MLLQVILEGLGLGALLVLVCAVGICKGAVGMVHLYSPAVRFPAPWRRIPSFWRPTAPFCAG